MASIELENIHLRFHPVAQRGVTFKEYLLQSFSRRAQTQRLTTEVHALRGITLKIEEGERLGIIGHNGAGKSTLLKLLAGIYLPTQGIRRVDGTISSMLELGVGIEPDADGWDNISFRGYLQGQSPQEVACKKESIAAFSELGEFMNMPVRYYSSGMMVRLVFSIASEIDPEILIVDEIFSAGDISFQEKARRRMLEVISRARILVMASHDLPTLRSLCTKVIWLDHGQIRAVGAADDVTRHYEECMRDPLIAA